MAGLLLLLQLHTLNDERVCEQWTLDRYFQYFCGEEQFQWAGPCEPSELVHFRHRIGEAGAERIPLSELDSENHSLTLAATKNRRRWPAHQRHG